MHDDVWASGPVRVATRPGPPPPPPQPERWQPPRRQQAIPRPSPLAGEPLRPPLRHGQRGRPRRPGRRLNRLAIVVLISVLGSAAVTVAAAIALPAKPSLVSAEPRFDARAFYRAHPSLSGSKAPRPDVLGLIGQDQPTLAGGLTPTQADNAFIIVEVGRQMGLPLRAHIVALATALQESNLRNLANPDVPESMRLPHEGTGNDHDSVGLFQQRPSMGWGTVAQLMDPAQSAARFYTRLARVNGWMNMGIAEAAQAVQRSAFPDAYAKHATRAQRIAETMP